MSFLKPTASSLQRASAIKEQGQAPAEQPMGLTSRIHSALFSPRSRAKSGSNSNSNRSPSLKEFTSRCDSVIQRAQQLLERTKDQEERVARALEQRLSQSPARRAASHEHTTTTATPVPPTAPPTTPVPAADRSKWFAWSTPPRTPPVAAPPPHPSPAPTSSPSLFDRVRFSIQRLSGQLPPAPPATPAEHQVCMTPPASARKSVKFVSPDKLESVTPTKMQPIFDEAASEEATPHPVAPPPSSVKRARSEPESMAETPTTPPRRRTKSPKRETEEEEEEEAGDNQATVTPAHQEHLDMIEFIKSNPVKKCVSTYSKQQLAACLHGEGVAVIDAGAPKKKLVEELKALLGK